MSKDTIKTIAATTGEDELYVQRVVLGIEIACGFSTYDLAVNMLPPGLVPRIIQFIRSDYCDHETFDAVGVQDIARAFLNWRISRIA